MLTGALEWVLLIASGTGLVLAIAHLLDSLRGFQVASSTKGSSVRSIVARMGRRSAILRILFAVVLLAAAFVLIRVPNEEMDYPGLVNGITAVMGVAAVLIVVFAVIDIRDRRRIGELLREV